MQMVTEEDVDLMLDADGQPTAGTDGQSELAEDDMCWLQDLKNEALTEEGELFYEDEGGIIPALQAPHRPLAAGCHAPQIPSCRFQALPLPSSFLSSFSSLNT